MLSTKSYELRGVIKWWEEKKERCMIIVRDTKYWLYESFEIDPKLPIIPQVISHLKINPEELKILEHVKPGLEIG